MLTTARRLQKKGIIGLNKRNADFILPLNPRRYYPLVDDKLKTKQLAENAGLATPPLYGVIKYAAEVHRSLSRVAKYQRFVIKPGHGSAGDGIIVINGRIGDYYQTGSGALISDAELRFHIQNALAGVFSLGGQPDYVLIEYCVQFDPVFKAITYGGVPDIRVIVLLGYPIMSMVRLPTSMSAGHANLHQGALGAGVDMARGCTLTAVWQNDIVTEHPDTGNTIEGVEIPDWDCILEISAQTYELTGLGYLGVDIILDKEKGPLLLELNARPGLNIQIGNQAGLNSRLETVLAIKDEKLSAAERIKFSKEHFAVRV